MHSLVDTLEGVAQLLALPALIVGALLLLAYHLPLVRDAVVRLFGVLREVLSGLVAALDALARTLRSALTDLRRTVTDDERIPLARLVVAVVALAPILFLIVIVEVRLWGAYFESLFPEQLEVPLLGLVPGGVLTALVPVAAGFLLGWMLEAVFGTFPLPVLSGLRSRDAQARGRGLLAIGLVVLWVFLAATVSDAANEVYDGLGESTCALQAAQTVSVTAEPALDPAAQATCVADWKANDRARSIRVILGELTLHLSALIAWVVLGALGLSLLAAVGALVLATLAASWLVRLTDRLVAALESLVESVLRLLHGLGAGLAHLLRGVGVPLREPEPSPVTDDQHLVLARDEHTNGVYINA